MSESNKFRRLLSRNPQPGLKNVLVRKDNFYNLPGWILEKEEELYINVRNLAKILKKHDITDQIFYDIYVLGLTDINQRPKCPICGNYLNFKNISIGYGKICGSKECRSKYSKIEVENLWKNKDYRKIQSNSHKEWTSKEENRDMLRKSTLNAWKDNSYRQRQIKAHEDWAKIEENRAQLRERSLKLWKIPGYRERLIAVHKEFAKNNPGKIRSGSSGIIKSFKSKSGELYFDSSWEKNFIELVNRIDEIVSIERADFSIPYSVESEKFNYFPDFCIITSSNKKYLIEIKANWMIKSDIKTCYKIDAGERYVEYNNEFSGYILLTDENLCDFPHYVKFNHDLAKRELLKRLI